MLGAATKSQPWYLRQRAESLAIMYLTRRQDLIVARHESDSDAGLDLLVTIGRDGGSSGRIFGVTVKAAVSSHNPHRNGGHTEIESTNGASSYHQDIPFPVLLFFFTMKDDQGYFRWIKEPVPDRKAGASLLMATSSALMPLTDAAIESIVVEVDAWYDRQAQSETTAG